MAESPFLDTNILVYLLSGDMAKADRAERLVADGGVISVQVLNEFVSVARRKIGLDWGEITAVLAALKANLKVVPLTLDMHERAVGLAAAHGFHIYDAAILAAAVESGCSLVWSEDLQHGQRIRGMRVANPFV